MYATDRRQTNVRRRTKTSLNVSALGAGHNKILTEQKVLSLDWKADRQSLIRTVGRAACSRHGVTDGCNPDQWPSRTNRLTPSLDRLERETRARGGAGNPTTEPIVGSASGRAGWRDRWYRSGRRSRAARVGQAVRRRLLIFAHRRRGRRPTGVAATVAAARRRTNEQWICRRGSDESGADNAAAATARARPADRIGRDARRAVRSRVCPIRPTTTRPRQAERETMCRPHSAVQRYNSVLTSRRQCLFIMPPP